ncbi:hypothetical protein EVAR_48961_1 [Eumeta japonica]|uniref:Uncharacterized protein n=1 Tax=Eumeta variegata TaxID=151549 RepID=A0A4C1Y6H7_EUMVA|nr:hypothetical protein EVAR_48961_1 [Eumeta japonica]
MLAVYRCSAPAPARPAKSLDYSPRCVIGPRRCRWPGHQLVGCVRSCVDCVRPLSLFYLDASAAEVEERSLVPRSRSHARLRRNATMSHAFSRARGESTSRQLPVRSTAPRPKRPAAIQIQCFAALRLPPPNVRTRNCANSTSGAAVVKSARRRPRACGRLALIDRGEARADGALVGARNARPKSVLRLTVRGPSSLVLFVSCVRMEMMGKLKKSVRMKELVMIKRRAFCNRHSGNRKNNENSSKPFFFFGIGKSFLNLRMRIVCPEMRTCQTKIWSCIANEALKEAKSIRRASRAPRAARSEIIFLVKSDRHVTQLVAARCGDGAPALLRSPINR